MRKYDLFPKVADESFDVRTPIGGAISLVTFGMMLLIVLGEFASFSRNTLKQEAYLPPPIKGSNFPIEIFMNITVAYPCQLLHLKMFDISGKQEMAFRHSIQRTRLDTHLHPISEEFDDNNPRSIMYPCGGCLGSNYTKCCLTCFDIAAAFKLENKLVPNLNNVEQCDRDKKSIGEAESCRIVAKLNTDVPQAELRIDAGGQINLPVLFKHDLTYFGENVNLSHWIENLRFGPEFKGMQNPLDKARWLQRQSGFYHYDYVLDLVQTMSGDIQSIQYSAMFNDKQIQKTVSKKHPGISFMFQTTPIAVRVVSTKKSLSAFLINLCAIIGGGFTIGGLFDSFVFKVNNLKKD